MSAAMLLEKLCECRVKLWVEGEELHYRGPKKALTPEVLERLRDDKLELIAHLRNEPTITSITDVFEMAREFFPNREDLPVPPSPPGRDPLAKHGTDKTKFFRGDCRVAQPTGWRVRRRPEDS